MMKKITLKSPGNFEVSDVPEPSLKDGEALVEVKSMGVCAGDISQYVGKKLDVWPLPTVQCHEFGGIVTQVKDSSGKIKVGDKVAASPHIYCGDCYYCNRGLELTCDNDKVYGINIDGGLAEKVAVPVKILKKLGDDFDIKYASIIEPATVAYNLVKDIQDSIIMIVGTGSIGVMAVPIAKHFNNKVIAVDIDEDHLNTAKKLGADLAVNFNDKDKNKKIEDMFGSERVDFVGMTHVDQQLWDWAVEMVRRCATIAFIDITAKPMIQVDFRKLWSKILTLKGLDSLYFNDFENAGELVEKGVINPEEVVSKLFPMSEVKEAYDYKVKNNALKVILTN
ncbi:MAG: alcohol dehydrogenase catalytic domain-containing protein [Candidatus Humimicrobiaceae bacterium]